MFDEGLFQTFPRERVPAEELPEQRAVQWRVSGYDSCRAGRLADELPPLAGRHPLPREDEKTPAEINNAGPHPEGIMSVPCVWETIHVMLAKLANGAPRCCT